MKKLLWTLLYSIFFLSSAKAGYYRLDHYHGNFLKLRKYFDPVFNQGRMQIYRVKNTVSLKSIPTQVLDLFVKIKKNEWKVVGPQKLTEKIQHSSSIQVTLDEISEIKVREHLKYLINKPSRKMGSNGNRETVNYISEFLKNYGYEVKRGCFKKGVCNTWGIKEGEVDEFVLIEAHLDSVGALRAGADDNASGASALLEMARLLSEQSYKRGIIIFATNGEEDGLLGSKYFVKKAEKSGLLSKISFFINMDMISWNKNGIVDIETNREFEGLARWMSSIANRYTNLRPEITMPAWGSDHVPFLKKGVPGVLTIEHWKTKSPCYHQPCDKFDTLNIPYLLEIIKLNMAASLHKLNE